MIGMIVLRGAEPGRADMERLTFKLGDSNPSYGLADKASAKPGLFTDYDGFFAHLLATHRLGQYEDTGLTPEDVAEMALSHAQGCEYCNSSLGLRRII